MLNSSVAIASVFGPFMVILGAWMLVRSSQLIKVWASFKSHPASFFLLGVMNLLLGVCLVSQYNFWYWSKGLLVTLLGWLLTVRGLIALFFPDFFMKHTMTEPALAKVVGWVPFIWGLILCWLAFV